MASDATDRSGLAIPCNCALGGWTDATYVFKHIYLECESLLCRELRFDVVRTRLGCLPCLTGVNFNTTRSVRPCTSEGCQVEGPDSLLQLERKGKQREGWMQSFLSRCLRNWAGKPPCICVHITGNWEGKRTCIMIPCILYFSTSLELVGGTRKLQPGPGMTMKVIVTSNRFRKLPYHDKVPRLGLR